MCNQLDNMGLEYELFGLGEFELKKNPSIAQQQQLIDKLGEYGIEVVNDQQSVLVNKIKDAIEEMIEQNTEESRDNISVYLSNKLNYSYSYLSGIFSELTHTSIENFVILKKIDFAKSLMLTDNYTLTEIAYKLNYSSVAHLSAQFKKTTGLTPSAFQTIIKRRKAL